jgi:D-alanyl-D-alanine carboxypeptidase (penicillin-binding protein 5/6)
MNSPIEGGARKRRRRGNGRLAVLVLVLLALGAAGASVVLGGQDDDETPTRSVGQGQSKPAPPASETGVAGPRLPPGISLSPDEVHLRFKRPPRAGLLFDVDSGELLWSRNALEPLPIASLTKVMTALIVVDELSPHAKTRISKAATKFRGSGVGVLPRGKKVPVEALLAGMLLPSGNDAAVALAEAVAGTDRRFAKLATRRAKQLELGCTSFADSYGLRAGNRSCAADLAALTRLAMRQPRIARLVRHTRVNVPFPIKGRRLDVSTTNPLLREGFPGTIGLKTGYTERAGHCLIAVVRRGGRTLAAIVLNSPNTKAQAKRLLIAGFRALG